MARVHDPIDKLAVKSHKKGSPPLLVDPLASFLQRTISEEERDGQQLKVSPKPIVLAQQLMYTYEYAKHIIGILEERRYRGRSMTLDELITEMRDKDIRIFDDGNAFKLHAPKGILTPQLLEVITAYQGELLYLVRLGDVRVCPARWEHRPQWRYSRLAQKFVCRACRGEAAA